MNAKEYINDTNLRDETYFSCGQIELMLEDYAILKLEEKNKEIERLKIEISSLREMSKKLNR